MAVNISYNVDEFRSKVRALFEGVEHEAYDKLKQAATDIQDAVATITTAEALKNDGVIDDDSHQEIEANGLKDLEASTDELETATDEFADKEAEEGNPDVVDSEAGGENDLEGDDVESEEGGEVKPEGDGIPPVEADTAVPGEPVGGEEADDAEQEEEPEEK